MFERYTEKARRVIFFARYEASNYGSPYIETEQLLLGLLREDKALSLRFLPAGAGEKLRATIDAHSPRRPSISTSVNLPLSDESKQILTLAAHEADELTHRSIGTGHLLLGMLQQKECFAAVALRDLGVRYEKVKDVVREFSGLEGSNQLDALRHRLSAARRRLSITEPRTVLIHNTEHDLESIRAGANRCRNMLWYWTKKTWQPQDVAVRRSDGRISFDLSLAEDTASFQLVQNGWNHDLCSICGWKLYVAPEPEYSTGYTNGRIWVCTECYDKFLAGPDFFATAHPEIT
jgi:Clp amino terminal domain, pathogenicity island component